MTTTTDGVRERLLAYILPRRPGTPEQLDALERAATAQAEYDAASGMEGVPGNVTGYSIDDVSVTFAAGGRGPSYTKDTISPVAWSILRNAGLIAYALPTARKP